MRTFLALLAAVNPPAVAVSRKGHQRALLMAGAAALTLMFVVVTAGAS